MRQTTKFLRISIILLLVFCASFIFFYRRAKNRAKPTPLILTADVINRELPKTNLVSAAGEAFDDAILRHGKVLLAFMMPDCAPCDQENQFLSTVANSRKDVRFVYVIPFGNQKKGLQLGQSKYAIEPVFDSGSNVARTLQINQVPIKVFLEDGIIKRTWIDATLTSERQTEFKNWLQAL